jgi:hypothetical protein
MRYYLLIIFILYSFFAFSQNKHLFPERGYTAWTFALGAHPSYFQHPGSTHLRIKYTEYDIVTYKLQSKVFILAHDFYREKAQLEIGLLGLEKNIKNRYVEFKTGIVPGNQGGSVYVTYGMGYRTEIIKGKIGLRLGMGIFYSGMTQELGHIDNYQKQLELLGHEYSEKFQSSNSSPTVDAMMVDVYEKYKCLGLKPKLGIEAPIGKSKIYLIRLNAGYNFVFAEMNRFRFKQRSKDHDTGIKQGYNSSDPELNYNYQSSNNAKSPFGMNGFFVNLEFVIRSKVIY